MKEIVPPLLALVLTLSIGQAHAGTVVSITNDLQTSGRLTLDSAAIHIDATSPSDIKLSDILEANFTEMPFQFNFFSSAKINFDKLPEGWTTLDLGKTSSPGKLTYASGKFTMTAAGSAVDRAEPEDFFLFTGIPWIGDGQWTARIASIDPQYPHAEAGLMIRDSLDPNSVMFGLGAFNQPDSKALFHYRNNYGDRRAWGGDTPLEFPAWLRITRRGTGVEGSYSADGKSWISIGYYGTKLVHNPWVGLFLNSRSDQRATVTLDDVTFTPPPASCQVLPAGVMLKSGSFLVGSVDRIPFDPAHPDAIGFFSRSGKQVSLKPSQITAVVMTPVTKNQLEEAESQVGILEKNGDFLAGDFNNIDGGGANLTSITFGPASYPATQIAACLLNPIVAQAADYEIRLTDGSIIRASGLGMTNGQVVVQEISGINIAVDPSEIAQFRAGTSRVQNILDFPCTVHDSATPASASTTPIQVWSGSSQEQVVIVPSGTQLDFPLGGKFINVAMKVMLAQGAPPHTQMSVRILADGREVGRTPAFDTSGEPRFIEFPLPEPKKLTLEVDTSSSGVSALIIDPLVARETPK